VVLVVLSVLVGTAALVVAAVVIRRRSVRSGPGAFRARIRVSEGAVEGLSRDWRDGYGRWVRDVLVWDSAPFLFQTRLIPVEGVDTSGIHGATTADASHLGKDPVVLPFVTEDHGHLEIVVSASDRDPALGPFARAAAVGSLVRGRLSPGRADQ
jgi:hypothetical protein